MIIKELKLFQFRNLASQSMTFHPKVNIFIGNNGQGKTNFAESIYTLVYLRSFRSNKLNELIQFDKDYTQCSVEYETNTGIHDLSFIIEPKRNKVFKDKIEIKKKSDFIGQLNAVVFVPEDLLLLKLAPSLRRSFIDLAISQIDNTYVVALTYYQKLMKQRNQFLKSNPEKSDKYLNIINEHLFNYGNEIFQKRNKFVEELKEKMMDIFPFLTDQKETFNLTYEFDFDYHLGKDVFMNKMDEVFENDNMKNETKIGIHRDDLYFEVNEIDAKKFASQGQQRTFVLSLKLALIEWIFDKKGEYPILILDDVFSEIDIHRKNKLLKHIENKVQTFITTTDFDYLNQFLSENSYKRFTVRQGSINKEE